MKFAVLVFFTLFIWGDAFWFKTVPSLSVDKYLGRWYQVCFKNGSVR